MGSVNSIIAVALKKILYFCSKVRKRERERVKLERERNRERDRVRRRKK